jgi:hypothetical protein
MIGCNAVHAFFLTYLLTFFLTTKPYGKRYTRFLIKICGYHDGIYVKAPASFFSRSTGERYRNAPVLNPKCSRFRHQNELKHTNRQRLEFAITSVWHSTNDGENRCCYQGAKEIAIIGGSRRQQDGIRQRWRIG